MRSTTRAAALLLAAGLALGLAACSDDDGKDRSSARSVKPVELPTDLCAAVPADLKEKWALETHSHDTTSTKDSTTATCLMSGSYLGKPLDLDLRLTSLAGTTHDAALKAMDAGVATACADLRTDPPAFTESDHNCRLRTPTQVTEVARSVPAHGVVRVRASFGGDNEAGVAAEVVGLAATLGTTDPAGLG